MGHRRKRRPYITPKIGLNIVAWNIRTGHHVGQKEIIASELAKCNIPIAALSELRLTGSGTVIIQPPNSDKTMTLYYSGGDNREAGVGFMVDGRAGRSVIAFQPISDRLAVLTVHSTIKAHIVSAYAPTETSHDIAKDDFYNQLQYTVDMIPQTELIILIGDFNAHTGMDRSGWETTVGKFGYGEINDNRQCLLSFAASNSLIIGNTCFQHPLKHQLTWRNPSGEDSAVLDYFLINHRFR
ncbi:craniofacial development protein 2-like [Centruroides vittatus]|uniref:craniofacial development protein 2-like n=1 Tax=Centruroides vittatus TaxID=120091 RepID=UPI0035105F7B